MGLFEKYSEKTAASRQKRIEEEAKSRITLSEYKGELYITFDGFPLVLISDKEQVPQITEKLADIRASFIKYRTGK